MAELPAKFLQFFVTLRALSIKHRIAEEAVWEYMPDMWVQEGVCGTFVRRARSYENKMEEVYVIRPALLQLVVETITVFG